MLRLDLEGGIDQLLLGRPLRGRRCLILLRVLIEKERVIPLELFEVELEGI